MLLSSTALRTIGRTSRSGVSGLGAELAQPTTAKHAEISMEPSHMTFLIYFPPPSDTPSISTIRVYGHQQLIETRIDEGVFVGQMRGYKHLERS